MWAGGYELAGRASSDANSKNRMGTIAFDGMVHADALRHQWCAVFFVGLLDQVTKAGSAR